MKYLLLICFLFLLSSDALSQSAFDSSCYYPEMGNPNELDTIYGSQANQGLGDDVKLFPPLEGQEYERLVMLGLPGNIPFLTAVETGPTFDLHKLKTTKKYQYIFEEWPSFKLGHFRSPSYTDIIAYDPNSGSRPVIYWADENGEFDSSRSTRLIPFPIKPGPHGSGVSMQPYIGKFSNDTVDDIILGVHVSSIFPIPDSAYIVLIKGGQHLFDQGRTAMWDDTVYFSSSGPRSTPEDTIHRTPYQGDFRGVGREDLVARDDWGNYFFYRNDLPFDLRKLAKSLKEDTLISISDWSQKEKFNYLSSDLLPMRAFPKQSWDKSVDMLTTLPLEGIQKGICIFKGGADFGSKRLYLDSCDFLLHHPGFYSGSFYDAGWPGEVVDCDDLTGTGNPVLGTRGGYFTYGFSALYVLGKALDDKIDVFFSQTGGGYGGAGSIIATNKGLRSYYLSAPAYNTPEDQDKGIFQKGSFMVLYGSEKIPVRLNPMYAVAEQSKLDTSIHHIIAYPNPCDQKTVITFDNCTGDKMLVDVTNAKGEVCQSEVTPSGFGLQEYALFLNSQPEGTYYIRLTCPRYGWSATTNVVKTGAYQTPWKLDLRKAVGR